MKNVRKFVNMTSTFHLTRVLEMFLPTTVLLKTPLSRTISLYERMTVDPYFALQLLYSDCI